MLSAAKKIMMCKKDDTGPRIYAKYKTCRYKTCHHNRHMYKHKMQAPEAAVRGERPATDTKQD